MNLSKYVSLIVRTLALAALLAAIALARTEAQAGVMTFPGLTAIRFTEVSGVPIPHVFLPNSPQIMTQLGILNGGFNDFQGVPPEVYDVFYSDANGVYNLNGNYVTVEARFPGQGGGGLNIAAVDLLLGAAPFTVCRADILSSFVGLGSNFIPGSVGLAVDPDLPAPITFTTMGNTAGMPGRLRVTVGWSKIVIPEPATASLAGLTLVTSVAVLRRRRRSVTRSTRRTVMSQHRTLTAWSLLVALISYASFLTSTAQADPLPGRDLLKFSQKPMIQTTVIDPNGTPGVYFGHDELSTAYGFPTAANNVIPFYSGRFMADDFADKLSSPVVHVKWWGSYAHDIIDPSMPVDKFLISFESDMPAGPAPSFSHPDQPLLNQVVTRAAALAPGSGTYTEKLIRGPDPILGESLYEYNAELHLGKDFPEKRDTVYWIKIAALVDVPAGIVFPANQPPPFATQWGWHNRDYTIPNPLASPVVVPGETNQGPFAGVPVWHFQDDAVSGDVRIDPLGPGGLKMPIIFQANMKPENYLDGIDGPAGAVGGNLGIGRFSKDLAFELYTVVPEPTSCLLMLVGLAGVTLRRRSRVA
jgi:hypothetical protein